MTPNFLYVFIQPITLNYVTLIVDMSIYVFIMICIQHCINYIKTFNKKLILDYFLTTQKTQKAKFEQYKVFNAISRFFGQDTKMQLKNKWKTKVSKDCLEVFLQK